MHPLCSLEHFNKIRGLFCLALFRNPSGNVNIRMVSCQQHTPHSQRANLFANPSKTASNAQSKTPLSLVRLLKQGATLLPSRRNFNATIHTAAICDVLVVPSSQPDDDLFGSNAPKRPTKRPLCQYHSNQAVVSVSSAPPAPVNLTHLSVALVRLCTHVYTLQAK